MAQKNIYANTKKKKKISIFTHIWIYVRTLRSNKECVARSIGAEYYSYNAPDDENKGRVKRTWWIAIIFFFIAMALAMTPLTVHAANTNGSDIFPDGYTYGVDQALYSMVVQDDNYVAYDGEIESFEFVSDSEKTITLDPGVVETTRTSSSSGSGYTLIGYHTSVNTTSSGSISLVKDLDIYYIPDFQGSDDDRYEEISTYTYRLTNGQLDTSDLIDRNCSFLIFTESNFITGFMVYGDDEVIGSIYGDYLNLEYTGNFIEMLAGDGEVTTETVFANFCDFCDKAYLTTQSQVILVNSLLIVAVNAGITLIIGLIVFLMTRGKNNPFRKMRWYECFLCVFYASLFPGIIAMILGFLFSGYEIMMYIIIFGVRAMWMAMRSLRPQVY